MRGRAWGLRSEFGLARALWWAVRRHRAIRDGDVVLPYTDRIAVMLWTTVGIGVVETAVVHLLVGLPWLRWTLLAVSLYGLLWLVALAFTLRQHPHVLRDGQLLLRFGHFRETAVPLEHLDRARVHVRTGHARNIVVDGEELALTVAGETDVELTFTAPVEVTVKGTAHAVRSVQFFADDPRAAVRALSSGARQPDGRR